MNKKSKSQYCSFIIKTLYLVVFFTICIWFTWSQISLPSELDPDNYYRTEFNEHWYQVLENGDRVVFAVPGDCGVPRGETAVLEKRLPENISSNMWLCFRTSRQDMNVYIDGELRKSYSTKETRPWGNSSVSTYLFVELDNDDSGKMLTLEMISHTDNFSGVMRSVLYGDKLAILSKLLQENSFPLIFSALMLFLGIACVCICAFLQYKFKTPYALMHLAWCVIVSSIWILTQTKIRQLFFTNISATSAYSHFILFIIPIPFAIYLNNIQKGRYAKFYYFFEIFSLGNAINNIYVIASGTREQTDLEPYIYLVILLLIGLAFATIIMDFRKGYLKQYSLAAFGFLGAVVSCLILSISALDKTVLLNGSIFCLGMIFMLIMATIQTIKDLLQSAQKRQQELATSEAKSDFLTSMSHEIRTPINAILGFTDIVAAETTEEHIREYTKDIQTAGRSLLAIINDILDFSKLESGKMKIVPLEYDLASVINDSCSIVKMRAEKKGLLFQTICDEELPSRLYGDEVRIRQILINLLTNAIKYTNEGSVTFKINGHTNDKGEFIIRFAIKDTGIGIKEESIPVLFDSFSRVDDSQTHQIEGTGLGLNIVRTLTELMHGEIKVESVYGKGSTFTVFLPQKIVSNVPIGNLADAHLKAARQADTEFVAPDAKILVVDDAAMNLKVFCGLLKDTLMQIDTASSGRECLTKLYTDRYDIIFLDHMMPGMDGIETLKHIRKIDIETPGRTPVIMLTANAILGAKEGYLQNGFDDYLAKPIKQSQLLNLLRKHLPKDLLSTKEALAAADAENSIDISKITFLNTQQGLTNHCDDEEFYLEIMDAYAESDSSKEVQSYYDSQNWHDYQIRVHALGSSSKLIGAEDLCTMFRALEKAAKESDITYIHNHHDEVMAAYKDMVQNINNLLHPTTVTTKATSSRDMNFQILVVDDDIVNLKAAKKILDNFFQVTCLENAPEAIEYAASHTTDLILLDIHMPEMNGFEVLRSLQDNPSTKNIPVIFLTADEDYETEVNSFKFGAMDFIRKPFIPDIMLERIHRIMERERLQQHLQNEMEKTNTKVEQLSLQAMTTLAQTIDAKDKYTKGHSSRVAKYSKKLAIRLGYSPTEQDTVYFMGLLHDIGKIGIPDSIINKPQKLTDEEYTIVRTHPIIGYDILKNIKDIPQIEQAARWHHERMDGTGYPDGLSGDEIPKFVRIISVADSYDAMTSQRSYRDILPQYFIKSELRKGKGTQFDPEVVEAMIQLIDEDIDYSMNGLKT